MERLFLSVLHTGITAGYLILAVAAARLLLKKAPKNMVCMLWMVVGLRLLCPFRIETPFGLLPKQTDTFLGQVYDEKLPSGGVTASDVPQVQGKDAMLAEAGKTDGKKEEDKLEPENKPAAGLAAAAAWVWLAGLALLLLYLLFSWRRMKKRVEMAVPAESEGIRFYQCGHIVSPFLFGLAAPKIYVPFSVSGQELLYVLKHEEAHKRRYDYLTKLIGYVLLSVYWFQPLVWAAYLLFCRDMELACDERVVKEIGEDCKKAYSQALLSCSKAHASVTACPVAFGEIGVKDRVKNVLNYKKPGIFILIAAAAVCVIVTACFTTEAKDTGTAANTETMQDRKAESAAGIQAGKAESGKTMQPEDTAPAASTQPEDTAPAASTQSENTAPAASTQPENTAPAASTQPENTAPAASTQPENTAPAASTQPENTAPAASTQPKTESSLQEEAGQKEDKIKRKEIEQSVIAWAEAYCGRQAEVIYEMLDKTARKSLNMLDGKHSFGWSSPWPWDVQEPDGQRNYRLKNVSGTSSVILYYAWTSDPHVTVWRQVISYQYSEKKKAVVIHDVTTDILDDIQTASQFYAAYPDGEITLTRMDYQTNGVGEALNRNGMLDSSGVYLKPDTAAAFLLNISNDSSLVKAEATEQNGETVVTFTFLKDGGSASVKMVRIFGKEPDIWVPQTYETAD
ncbi:MAG: hypothetical protein K2N87_08260 [Eubacterium sp.]|nr:hypothetical protein [Eubacterium sp.]